MSTPPLEFFELSKKIGKEIPIWIQGAGGNISIKQEGTLWIKSSGVRLESINESTLENASAKNPGYTPLELKRLIPRLSDLLNKEYSDKAELEYAQLLKESIDLTQTHHDSHPSGNRPSMETGFHALLPGKYVMHFHSLVGVLMAHASQHELHRWKKWCQAQHLLEGSLLECLVISPVILPGLALSKASLNWVNYPIILLSNHGIILQTDDPNLLDRWELLERSFCKAWNFQLLANLKEKSNLIQDSEFRRELSENLGSMPIKLYFPDTAVFLEKLMVQTIPQGGITFSLKDQAWTSQPDICEIWLATQLLFQAEQDLEEIPNEMIAALSNMPTEKFRIQKQEKSEL